MIKKMCCADGGLDETCVLDGGEFNADNCTFAIELNKNGMTKNCCEHWRTVIVCDECGHTVVLGESLHQPQDAQSGVAAIIGKLSDLTDKEAEK